MSWTKRCLVFMVLLAPFIKIVWGAACLCAVRRRVGYPSFDFFFSFSHPRPDMAGVHPNHLLLGFSAALAPKFHPFRILTK